MLTDQTKCSFYWLNKKNYVYIFKRKIKVNKYIAHTKHISTHLEAKKLG